MPVNARCTPLQRAQHAGLQRAGRVAQRVDQLVGALVALPPLADAAVDDLLQMIAARQLRGSSRVRIARCASPLISMPSSCPT